MASNALFDIFKVKELRDRIFFTLGLLLLFRFGAHLPIPGIDGTALKAHFSNPAASGLSLTDYFDFFSGGAFTNFSIFMLGVMPYISMSIIMQLMVVVFPRLKKIQEEEGGKKRIHKYTRIGTIVVSLIQSYSITLYANSINVINKNAFEGTGTLGFTLLAMLTVTTGTMFLMWMGEQINQRGIGNGISLLIFTGIVARMPDAVVLLGKAVNDGLNIMFVLLAGALFIGAVILVIFEQQGQRKIPVNYAKRVVGRKMYGSQSTYIPFKINPSGVIPIIFASSLLTFPLQILGGFSTTAAWVADLTRFLDPHGIPYLIMYTLLIVFFAYFYTQVSLNPIEISKQIREHGGSIPGIRSEKMEEYLTKILNRIILPGSLFLALIAVIPSLVTSWFGFPQQVAYLLGGTSLLILVGVDLDTMSQIEGHLRMHHHEGIAKKGTLRSRNL